MGKSLTPREIDMLRTALRLEITNSKSLTPREIDINWT